MSSPPSSQEPADRNAPEENGSNGGIPAYESPNVERPASAAPTEQQLERESPLGYAAHQGGRDPYAALRVRNYRLYAIAFWMSVIGGQSQTVAVSFEIFKRTGSPLSLGLLGLAMAAPVMLLALPAGHIADTHSRRRIMLASHVMSFLVVLVLGAMAMYWPTDGRGVYVIYGLMILGNAGATFGRPARAALMPQLLPKKLFPNAVTWNSTIFETASMVGPLIAGFMCDFSLPVAYAFTAASWLTAIVFIYLLPNVQPPQRSSKPMPSWRELAAGVGFVWRSKMMLGTMTLDMFAVLLGGVTFLLPVFAKELSVGGWGFGFLRAAPSLGALGMAMIIAHTPPFRRAGRALLLSVAAFGVVTIVFGLSQNFYLSFAMLVLVGAFDNVSVVIRHTLLQLLTPDAMRGRVSAVNQVFIGSSNEIGGLRAGLMGEWIGPVASVVFGGIGTILVVFGVGAIWPQVRKLKSLQDVAPPVEPSDMPREIRQVVAQS